MRQRRKITGGAALLLLLVGGSAWIAARPRGLPSGVVRVIPVAQNAESIRVATDALTGRIFVQTGDVTRGGTFSVLDARSDRLLRATLIGPYPYGHIALDTRHSRAFVLTGATMVGNGNGLGTAVNARLYLFDTRTGRLAQSVAAPASSSASIAIDARTDHAFVAYPGGSTGTSTGVVRMLDGATGRLLYTLPIRGDQLAVDERLGRAFVVDAQANRVRVVDTQSGQVVRTIAAGRDAGAVAVDEHAGRLFIGSSSRWTCGGNGPCRYAGPSQLTILDTHTGQVVRTITSGTANPGSIAVDESVGHAFVFYTNITNTHAPAGFLRMLDTRTGRVLRVIATDVAPVDGQVAVDERRGRVYAVDGNKGLLVFNATSGALLRTVAAPADTVAIDGRTGRAIVVQRWEPHPVFIDLNNIRDNIQAHFTGHWSGVSSGALGHMPGNVMVVDASH